MLIAYAVSRFPHCSETFIVRELDAVSARPGIDVELFTLFGAQRDDAARPGIAHRVRFVGGLPEQEVARMLATADLFVLPSVVAGDGQMEGLPVALMEAPCLRCAGRRHPPVGRAGADSTTGSPASSRCPVTRSAWCARCAGSSMIPLPRERGRRPADRSSRRASTSTNRAGGWRTCSPPPRPAHEGASAAASPRPHRLAELGGAEMLLADFARGCASADLQLSVAYLAEVHGSPAAARLRDSGIEPASCRSMVCCAPPPLGAVRRHIAQINSCIHICPTPMCSARWRSLPADPLGLDSSRHAVGSRAA